MILYDVIEKIDYNHSMKNPIYNNCMRSIAINIYDIL